MADFSINATQLAEPQGAGAKVISPVQSMDTGPNPLNSIFGNVVDIFAKGLANNQKAQQEAQKNEVVGQFVKEQTRINQSVRTGQMSAAEADVHYRANFSSFAERNPSFLEDFRKASDALKGSSEQGTVDTEIRLQREQRQKDISDAAKDGMVFVKGMSEETIDSAIKNHKLKVQARAEFQDLVARNNEYRAGTNFNQAVADREMKDASFNLISKIAGSEIQDAQRFSNDLGVMVRSGKMPFQEAQIKLTERFSNIEIALQSAARTNPELAAPYRTIFATLNTMGQKLIDPKAQAEDVKNQFDILVGRMKLMAVQQDPKTLAAVTTSQLFPASIDAALAMNGEAVRTFTALANVPVQTKEFVPQVVGNPTVEPQMLGFLKESIKGLGKLNGTDKEKASVEASNTVNHILKQTGDWIDRGATPDKLVGLAKFYASPEYAELVAKGMIDGEASKAANKTFELMYRPAIEQDIRGKLNQYLYEKGRVNLPGYRSDKAAEPKALNDFVDIKFSGTGITFVGKDMDKLDPAQRSDAIAQIRQLNGVEAAVNQLIKMGSHLEGKTDYSKFWESNKHIWFPDRFKAPESEKPVAKAGSEEQIIKAMVSGTDSGKNLTRDTLNEILKDVQAGKLTKEQEKTLREALKGIMN